ncbi:MAG TPA: hypothetical protein VMA31_03925 [Bryobacteraceae bacterium]|nr:hypothetical protein [Bryobacteraceae bacterium]
MALGEFTKQIAQQAILSATSKEAPPPAPAAPPSENPAAVLLGQISAMQKALKEDEELVVNCQNIRVVEIFTPSRTMAVVTGHDSERNLTRIIGGVESLQFACRVVKVHPGVKAARINLVTPR